MAKEVKKVAFLTAGEYVAESYLEASEEFETFSEWYEERYDTETHNYTNPRQHTHQ